MRQRDAFRQKLRSLQSDTSGSVAVIAAVAFPVVIGGIGMGAEAGYWYMLERQLQHAADFSAHAAAVRMRVGDDQDVLETVALHVAQQSGFPGAGGDIDVNWPPLSGSRSGEDDAVEVVLTRNVPRLFSSFFVDDALVLEGRAVAQINSEARACVLALNRNAEGAVKMTGSTSVSLDQCDLASNSQAATSVYMTGSASLSTGCVYAAGQYTETGSADLSLTVCDEVTENWREIGDPYSYLPEPEPNAPCQSGSIGKSNKATTVAAPSLTDANGLKYTRYCSLDLKGNVTFPAGLYIVDGNFSMSGGGSVAGDGVTFFIAGAVKFTGNVGVTLSAPTSDVYAGILFFGDREAAGVGHKLTGNSTSVIQGAVYFPAGDLEFTGSSALNNGCTQIVANTILFTGSSGLKAECEGSGTTDIFVDGAIDLVE